MLIMTPLTGFVFANVKKSDSCKNPPSFWAFGFRNNEKFEYGLAIAAAMKQK